MEPNKHNVAESLTTGVDGIQLRLDRQGHLHAPDNRVLQWMGLHGRQGATDSLSLLLTQAGLRADTLARTEHLVSRQRNFSVDWPLRLAPGDWRHLHCQAERLNNEAGEYDGLCLRVSDLTAFREEQAFAQMQSLIIALLSSGASTQHILQLLSEEIERLTVDLLASILLLDDDQRHVLHAAAPSLPLGYVQAINGAEIGPRAGACGTAAWRREQVICHDIASDPLWRDYAPLALSHGLKACWSTPILDVNQRVLGTFALYAREPASPSRFHQRLLTTITQLAAMALQREWRNVQLQKLEQAIEHSPIGFVLFNAEQRIVYANASLAQLFGYTQKELLGSTWEVLHGEHAQRETLVELWQDMLRRGRAENEVTAIERDGSELPVQMLLCRITDHGLQAPGFLAIYQNLRERKAAEQALHEAAFHDHVTRLPNRALLHDRLSMQIAGCRRNQQFGALMLIDLDEFKRINDSHGHSLGDAYLRAIAERLREILREEDTLARLGGDEFAVLLPQIGEDADSATTHALQVAEKLRARLREPVELRGKQIQQSASIGLTILPKGMESPEDLLREADTAVFSAKEKGRDTIVVFEREMHIRVSERFELEQDLRYGLEQQQLQVYLQPQVDHQGTIRGAEALLRWQHPQRGLVSPVQFIPVAEQSGLIVPIGEWVLQQTLGIMRQCEAAGKPLRFAVNVSPRQFRQADFVDSVKRALQNSAADALHLTLELTEGLLIDDPQSTREKMAELADLGVHFSIDDFGTGYSSLSYLKRLPLRELKIDKSFVQDAPNDPSDAAIVETILAIAQHLHLTVIAEGVENDEQADFLRHRHCFLMQGYRFGRPIPAGDFVDQWLASTTPSHN